MALHDVWFALIGVLWTGYFFLEGFDFGVGVLSGPLPRDERERRVLINAIGPVWDGNEVWLLTAVGATFAAFPDWYAAELSGFYLPLLAVVVCLVVRAVAFEYRGKRDDPRWQRGWERAVVVTSAVPALLWGVVLADTAHGVPMDAAHDVTGGPVALFTPYSLLGGVVTLTLFTFHGAVFAALKTLDPVRGRARRAAAVVGPVALAALAGLLRWTRADGGGPVGLAVSVLAVAALAGALVANRRGREGAAFALSGTAVASLVGALFLALHPDVLPSTTDPAGTLTVAGAAAGPYTLRIMTWIAAAMTPLVVAYQGWTYWVFRRRIGTAHIPGPTAPEPSPPAGRR